MITTIALSTSLCTAPAQAATFTYDLRIAFTSGDFAGQQSFGQFTYDDGDLPEDYEGVYRLDSVDVVFQSDRFTKADIYRGGYVIRENGLPYIYAVFDPIYLFNRPGNNSLTLGFSNPTFAQYNRRDTQEFGRGQVTVQEAIPEPATAAGFAIAAVGAGILRYRSRGAKKTS